MLGFCQPLEYAKWVYIGRCTFHDACLVDCELEPHVADLDVCFGREGYAAEKQVQLSRRAGHCREDGRPCVVHGAMLWLRDVCGWYRYEMLAYGLRR
jgi:hypothetical protein